VLSPLEPLPPGSRDLVGALRPGIDGVVVQAGGQRGTFLPSVWSTLATPERFVAGLLAKAGLRPDPWPADLRAWRYTTDEFCL
jgi:AMMECR1 domain-containing protein